MPNKLEHLSFPQAQTKGDRTRLRIVEAALSVLAHHGGTCLTFEAVGAAAKMNRAQVRYHFPELAALVRDAMKLVAHRSQEYTVRKIRAAKTPREALECYLEAAFDSSVAIAEQIPLILYFQERALHEPEFRNLYAKVSTAGNERLAALLATVAGPLAEKGADLALLASSIRGLLMGLLFEMHVRQEQAKKASYVARAKHAVVALLSQALIKGFE